MKVLITGGAGFIGAHVAKALQKRGADIVLLDDMNDFVYPASLKEDRLNHFFRKEERPKLIVGSILDEVLLNRLCTEEKFDKVLHLAAHANPGKSVQKPDPYLLVNEAGTLQLLKLAAKFDIPQFIFASSSSIYHDEQTPFKEEMAPAPRSPYGVSKAGAELYCRLWHDLYGLPMTVLRFFSVYGPWGRPDMAPMIFGQQILHGQRLDVTSERKRDFTYIDDVVSAVIAALEKKFEYEVMNIGRGQPVEIMDLVRALEKAAGVTANIQSRSAPPGEMRITYADISKAQQLLDYQPSVSIEEGARRLIEWMKSHV